MKGSAQVRKSSFLTARNSEAAQPLREATRMTGLTVSSGVLPRYREEVSSLFRLRGPDQLRPAVGRAGCTAWRPLVNALFPRMSVSALDRMAPNNGHVDSSNALALVQFNAFGYSFNAPRAVMPRHGDPHGGADSAHDSEGPEWKTMDYNGIACEAAIAGKVPPQPERSPVADSVLGTCRSRIMKADLLRGE
ncbi:hypothetical protein HBH92_032010 [Parastagonospora nodorum]|nr:hypothetical protein HBI09_021480 [Parastagonospora nodorum]KAH4199087.1 hypothetical protein HBH42_052910 [Parastagonospora nodorum]KAH4420277.1 hypothetical protein HBH92_032010 [Parastagonospora nodorum]KAH4452831.1 hypothetical protein HBH93_029500 [Parastagonospora nodorum]KAH4466141.1 hypothetical protein HBH91_032030 [Parastagonospora nodorum]